MKEITRIITAQITLIDKCENPEEELYTKEETAEMFKEIIEENFEHVQDVVITAQDFELDVE